MCREPFSENSPMPESYKQLETDGMKKVNRFLSIISCEFNINFFFFFVYLLAVCHDPDFRPKISTVFNVLCNCFKLNSSSSLKQKGNINS